MPFRSIGHIHMSSMSKVSNASQTAHPDGVITCCGEVECAGYGDGGCGCWKLMQARHSGSGN